MFVRYLMSIITLEKIIDPMYNGRPKLDVDYYIREHCHANVLCTSDIRCRLLHWRKSWSRCTVFVRYSTSIVALEKNRRTDVLWLSVIRGRLLNGRRLSNRCIMFVRCSMSINTLKKVVEPMYYVRPIFDFDYYSSKNRRDDVCCSSDIQCRLLS